MIQLTKVIKHPLKMRWNTVRKKVSELEDKDKHFSSIQGKKGDKSYEKATKRRDRMVDFKGTYI